MAEKIKIIVLDRDGVINEDSPFYIKSPAEWHAIPGSLAAIAKLNHAGYKITIATNQSGLARGYFTPQILKEIHQKMQEELAQCGGHIDEIFICPHVPDDNCVCRKPKCGLLLQIAAKFKVTPQEMLVIGDSLRDIEAAHSAGCTSILVKTGNGAKILADPQKSAFLTDVLICNNLAAAADFIISHAL